MNRKFWKKFLKIEVPFLIGYCIGVIVTDSNSNYIVIGIASLFGYLISEFLIREFIEEI